MGIKTIPNLKQQYSRVNQNGRTMFMLQHPQNLSPQFQLGFQTVFSINGVSFIFFLKSGSTCAQQSRCLLWMCGSCHIITEGRHGKDLCVDAVREAVLFKSSFAMWPLAADGVAMVIRGPLWEKFSFIIRF